MIEHDIETGAAPGRPTRSSDALATGLEDLRRWLLDQAASGPRIGPLLEGLCARLGAAGVPVNRAFLSLRTIHPEVVAWVYTWEGGPDGGQAEESAFSQADRINRDVANDPDYQTSPVKQIHDGADELRFRLSGADAELFPVTRELRDAGYTDYVIFALPFSDGVRNTLSLATRDPAGFADTDLATIRSLVPILSLLVEVRAGRRMAAALLDTYVGRAAGERILNGQVIRGKGELVRAVILYADLSNFTRLSDTRPMDEVITLLDDWFEAMTRPIHAHGGQVLKYIGDGLLAIFPLGDAAFTHYTVRQALTTAIEAEAAVDALNAAREAAGQVALDYRLALHVGELMWGNIGAVDRLDFTAIGPSVNLAARLEALCGTLGERLLMSKAMADLAPDNHQVVSLGSHPLRGVSAPQEVFALRAAGGTDRGGPEDGG